MIRPLTSACFHLVDTKTQDAYFEDYDACSTSAPEARADRYRVIREDDIEDPARVAVRARSYSCRLVVCDGCKDELVDEDTGFTVHSEPDEDLRQTIADWGWMLTPSGGHLCPSCVIDSIRGAA